MDACNKVEPLRHGASLGFYSQLGQDKQCSVGDTGICLMAEPID